MATKSDIKKQTFKFLEKIRKQKKMEVIKYFKEQNEKAISAKDDGRMRGYFNSMLEVYDLGISDDSERFIKKDLEIVEYYINELDDFYDVLFLNSKGDVFYSVKKESDYMSNIFSDELSGTALSKTIRVSKEDRFIDYEHYGPSQEPAAFFVLFIKENGSHKGWIVLQTSINKVNSILSDYKNLGRTGEVYLVNKKKLFLTNSRFLEDATSLKMEVNTESVKRTLKDKKGSRLIKDYRGVKVFSSYEEFSCFGVSWIIIVEIDEGEVITGHYQKYSKYYLQKFNDVLAKRPRTSKIGRLMLRESTKVDFKEFVKVKNGELLKTSGIGTCTAVVIAYPGKFGYMAHISPTDMVYEPDPIARFFLRDKKTNFLDAMLNVIQHYDVLPSEFYKLKYYVVATHDKSIGGINNTLINNGVQLSQIRFMFNPDAVAADVFFDYKNDFLEVGWKYRENVLSTLFENSDGCMDLCSMVQLIAK